MFWGVYFHRQESFILVLEWLSVSGTPVKMNYYSWLLVVLASLLVSGVFSAKDCTILSTSQKKNAYKPCGTIILKKSCFVLVAQNQSQNNTLSVDINLLYFHFELDLQSAVDLVSYHNN